MMRGGGMRLRTWLSNKGLLIALVIFGAIESLLSGGALAEGGPPQSWESTYQDAAYFYREGDLQQALSHAARARRIVEKTGTDQRDSLAQVLSLEAVLLDRLGRHAESEPLHRRALKLREESLHPEDPRLAETLNNPLRSIFSVGTARLRLCTRRRWRFGRRPSARFIPRSRRV